MSLQGVEETEQRLKNAGWIQIKCTTLQLVDRQGNSWRLFDPTKVYRNPQTGSIVCLGKIQQYDPQSAGQQVIRQILETQLNAQQHQHDKDHECHDENCQCHDQDTQQRDEDIQTIMNQTGVDKEIAIQALEQHGNIAEAITALQQQNQQN